MRHQVHRLCARVMVADELQACSCRTRYRAGLLGVAAAHTMAVHQAAGHGAVVAAGLHGVCAAADRSVRRWHKL